MGAMVVRVCVGSTEGRIFARQECSAADARSSSTWDVKRAFGAFGVWRNGIAAGRLDLPHNGPA
jgi:hypothetical protein